MWGDLRYGIALKSYIKGTFINFTTIIYGNFSKDLISILSAHTTCEIAKYIGPYSEKNVILKVTYVYI